MAASDCRRTFSSPYNLQWGWASVNQTSHFSFNHLKSRENSYECPKKTGLVFLNLITIQNVLLLCLQKCARRSRVNPGVGKFRCWECQPSGQNNKEGKNSCSPPTGLNSIQMLICKKKETKNKRQEWKCKDMQTPDGRSGDINFCVYLSEAKRGRCLL